MHVCCYRTLRMKAGSVFLHHEDETESELGFSFPMSKKNCFWITATPMVSQKAVSQCNLWSGSQNVAYICFVFLFVSELVRLRVVFFPSKNDFKNEQTTFCSHDRVLPHLSWLASSTPPLGLLRPAARFSSTCRLMRAKWIFDSLFDCSHSAES